MQCAACLILFTTAATWSEVCHTCTLRSNFFLGPHTILNQQSITSATETVALWSHNKQRRVEDRDPFRSSRQAVCCELRKGCLCFCPCNRSLTSRQKLPPRSKKTASIRRLICALIKLPSKRCGSSWIAGSLEAMELSATISLGMVFDARCLRPLELGFMISRRTCNPGIAIIIQSGRYFPHYGGIWRSSARQTLI